MLDSSDIWYAMANTEVIVPPRQRLETFGNTVINYHLLSEKMDVVNEIRVREGRIHAERPQILTSVYFERLMLEGFGDEAQGYVEWMRHHFSDAIFLQYGFRFRKEERRESTIHETFETAAARVKTHVEQRHEPLVAVIKGVDDAWEICLLKFMTDTIRQSVPGNVQDLKRRKMLDNVGGIPRLVREEIEMDFDGVGQDPDRLKALGTKLCQYGIFESYEDRFYELVRRTAR